MDPRFRAEGRPSDLRKKERREGGSCTNPSKLIENSIKVGSKALTIGGAPMKDLQATDWLKVPFWRTYSQSGLLQPSSLYT